MMRAVTLAVGPTYVYLKTEPLLTLMIMLSSEDEEHEDEIENGFRTRARAGVWGVLSVAKYCLVVVKWQMSVRRRRKLKVL